MTGRIDAELRQHAKADPRARILTTLPGAVQFTAGVMLAGIGGITRSGSARKLLTRACHLLAGMQAAGTTTPLPRP